MQYHPALHPKPDKLRGACLLLAALSLVLLLLGQPSFAGATIYKWRDAGGHLHFSDSPPQNVGARPLDEEETSGRNTKTPNIDTPRRHTPLPPGPPSYPDLRQIQPAPDVGQNQDYLPPPEPSGRPGIFWKIEIAGKDPSYLLGTMHSSDPRILETASRVASSLLSCRNFVMESVMDTAALMQIGSSLLITDGSDLQALLGETWYQRLVPAAAERGIPEPFLRRMKPWVAMSILSAPAFQSGQFLDLVLYQKALAAGIRVQGLETTAEQLQIFEGLSLEDQVELLKMTIEQVPRMPLMLEELTRAYLEDDLEKIGQVAARFTQSGDQGLVTRFMNRLNTQRNQRMYQRLSGILEQGGAFIAVGALHLAGPQGLVARLRQAGFSLTPLH